ncbi:hypothetical protein EP47_12420 [Legionella norrlandica]|uniref:Uncharacterized protein n=1 Tax=Legionella norrlandica TaxID=1498499 RepID=A0A0A2T8T0_9GAMM|nr:hypothetical protein [Legionella norrlandica]KGP63828.1 hypothetical protein EP47_12420 [Legionella norrlandica]
MRFHQKIQFLQTVTAIDKAPLDPKIAELPRIYYLNQSAFALEPAKLDQRYDWVLSDAACCPDRAIIFYPATLLLDSILNSQNGFIFI